TRVGTRHQGRTEGKQRKVLSSFLQMRRPARQAMKDFPIVLLFDRDAADAFAAEGRIGNPAGVGSDYDTAAAQFGGGHQHARLVSWSTERLLIDIVGYYRARLGRMGRVQEQEIAGVVAPAQAADDRSALWENDLFCVRVKIRRLDPKASQQFVRIF